MSKVLMINGQLVDESVAKDYLEHAKLPGKRCFWDRRKEFWKYAQIRKLKRSRQAITQAGSNRPADRLVDVSQ